MKKELLKFLKIEQRFEFKGFDFSRLNYRMDTEPLPWSYTSSVIKKIRAANSPVMVDMGTGGGEVLLQMQPLPKITFATESYKPNIQIAKDKLEPLGVRVIETKTENELPFANDYFDLVINRHTDFVVTEVFRVLKKGGMFITQQVGGKNNLDLMKLLDTKKGWEAKEWNLKAAIKGLEAVGMKIIEAAEAYPKSRIYDAGALVYYLKAVPWVIPDFSIERYGDALSRIDDVINKNRYVEVKNHRLFVIAKK